MKTKYRVGDRVERKTFEEYHRDATIFSETNTRVDVGATTVLSLNKGIIAELPKTVTIKEIDDRCGFVAFKFKEGKFWYLECFIRDKSKYIVDII